MRTPEKLSSNIVDILTARLKDEYNAFYFYRSASNWCKNVGFQKAAAYFKTEAEDELSHAKGIEDFLVDWNITPDLPVATKPETNFAGLISIIDKAYDIEYKLYEAYEEDSTKILKIGDVCVFDFLQKYRHIQTTSVAEYSDMLNILSGVKGDKFELLLIEENLFGE